MRRARRAGGRRGSAGRAAHDDRGRRGSRCHPALRSLPPSSHLFPDRRKTVTTRLGEAPAVGPAWLLFEFDDVYRRLPGEIISVTTTRFDGLTDDIARLEGLATGDELRAGLRPYYPSITEASPVDVVTFELTS